MKRIFLLMVICCFVATKGFGQVQPPKDNKDNPNGPEITFEFTEYDFGSVPLKGLAECEFSFVNTGKEPLIVFSCQATCGCTVPTCPKEKPVNPGEKGSIKVKFTSTSSPGTFDKYFTVTTNAKNSVVRLTIKGVVSQNAETASN